MPLSDYDKSRISDWKRQIESKKIQLQNAKDEKKEIQNLLLTESRVRARHSKRPLSAKVRLPKWTM
jgi:hypothetical protein